LIGMAHISFATLPVLDLDRAIAFWRDVMGLQVSVDAAYVAPGGAPARWVMMEIPGARTQIHLDPVDSLPVTDRPALPLIVGDVEAEEQRLAALGVEILTPPTPAPWDPETLHALIRDSEGATILLISR
jgi:predicted enzyme related to lactoylglutathione lyase